MESGEELSEIGHAVEKALTIWKSNVSAKVAFGETSGKTAKYVSPTKPRVTLLTASLSTGKPSSGAATYVVRLGILPKAQKTTYRV